MTTLHDQIPLLNTVLILVLGVWVFFASRKWTGPSQNGRLDALDADVRILRGNVMRLDRDQTQFHRLHMDATDRLLMELRAMRESGVHPQCVEIKDALDRIHDVEQSLAAIMPSPEERDTP